MSHVSSTSGAPLYRDCAFDLVVIAASVGGIKAIRVILAALPAAFPATILIQTHLHPTYPSVLADCLRPHSPLPVEWAVDGATLRQGTVIVAPQGQHVHVDPKGCLTLISWAELGYTRPRADRLFESVAASFQTRAMGVVLTGYLDDGARGVQAIHAQGGRVLVQDPASAEASDMPNAAVRTGCADFVLPLPVLPVALTALVMVRGIAGM